jgi:hypothetical protein
MHERPLGSHAKATASIFVTACMVLFACSRHSTLSTPIDHRPSTPAACTPQSGPVSCSQGASDACHVPGDCTAGLDGSCQTVVSGGAVICGCVYDDCLTDADCAPGSACSCDANRGGAGASGSPTKCVTANCRVDADCGPSGYCSASGFSGGPGGCGSFVNGVYCHTAADECANAADCGASSTCVYSPEVAHWICAMVSICAG